MADQLDMVGIDVGSATVAVARVASDGTLLDSAYMPHRGRVRESVRAALESIGAGRARVACTAGTPHVVRGPRVDGQIATIEAVRRRHPGVRSILVVGAERFGRIDLDSRGGYRGTAANSSCAAGTGSFLDQQARRLGLDSVGDLAEAAQSSGGRVPRIASRCAVFARTDLIHAQQEGYSLAEICDGLCAGLAQSIVDAVFGGSLPDGPVALCGGVARNRAVARHLSRLLGTDLVVDDEGPLYAAHGAALHALRSLPPEPAVSLDDPEALFRESGRRETTLYPPLGLPASDYPDFASGRIDDYRSDRRGRAVEVEVFGDPDASAGAVLGIDIGSTSTKATIVGLDGAVIAGLYTMTAGAPVAATQALFEAARDLEVREGRAFRIAAAATTGSGRKLVGAIIGADLVLDEISAHARAAVALDPGVDTIIEIGGQDSKFTTLSDGHVTFARMNMVCAAGTGSFLEEQAGNLGCSLADYRLAEGVQAPLASDRCTVFMERDVHELVAQGFRTEEILAAVLHAVRENYLSKVAGRELGGNICFQGATARNRALVAAFEQKLGRRIRVARTCHLAGAHGAALTVLEDLPASTAFRGFGLAESDIPIRAETCGLCRNRCSLRVATVAGREVAYGFLCGRDYQTRRRVARGAGLDLVEAHRRAFAGADEPPDAAPRRPSVGLPAALPMAEHLPLWRRFFRALGIPVVTSELGPEDLAEGKRLAGAEFCAPMAALHGQAARLCEQADFVFLPIYLEGIEGRAGRVRQYCYYTQFGPSVVAAMAGGRFRERLLMPLVRLSGVLPGRTIPRATIAELTRALGALVPGLSRRRVAAALEEALRWFRRRRDDLPHLFCQETQGDVAVVLLGRPYTVLSPGMNKGIPGIFDSLGIRTFSEDMIPAAEPDAETGELLRALHWNYAAEIVDAAARAASMPGLYPVLVTSFKCTPDSMLIEYFERIMQRAAKPYLILQLDDHDSSVGYETRIEAAVRAFRNHAAARPVPDGRRAALPVAPRLCRSLDGRVLLLPLWDPLVHPLLSAALRRAGVDARLLSEDAEAIRRSMLINSGQCLPLSIIVQECNETIRRESLDPARTAVWMMTGTVACNFGLFAHFIKTMLEREGLGEVAVYAGNLTNVEFSLRASIDTYLAYLIGGILRRLACRIRPHERATGDTDRAVRESHAALVEAFAGRAALDSTVERRGPEVRGPRLGSGRSEAQGGHLRGPVRPRQRRDEPGPGPEHRSRGGRGGDHALHRVRRDRRRVLFPPLAARRPPSARGGQQRPACGDARVLPAVRPAVRAAARALDRRRRHRREGAERAGRPARARRRVLRQHPQGAPPARAAPRPRALRAGGAFVLLSGAGHGGAVAADRRGHWRARGHPDLRRHGDAPERPARPLHRRGRRAPVGRTAALRALRRRDGRTVAAARTIGALASCAYLIWIMFAMRVAVYPVRRILSRRERDEDHPEKRRAHLPVLRAQDRVRAQSGAGRERGEGPLCHGADRGRARPRRRRARGARKKGPVDRLRSPRLACVRGGTR